MIGNQALPNTGCCRRDGTSDVKDVLHRNGNTVERSAVHAVRELTISLGCLRARLVRHDQGVGVQPRVALLDAPETRIDHLDGAGLARAKLTREALNAQ